ncbi:MSMEG_0569 family flavin-dependent oxidoreductase [Archangium minus]|uniref:MSMEG_0569 family flavin-dependent oxidoreductase n=1 Tax=Archangium minus TaxID=83450 RepID=A0ABY9X174_9BACT|nr:MSMEG_0569 family flavin-dependent oxidoreductase [Archangium minus]
MSHHNVIVIGGGQAGLSASYYLQQRDINHLVLESRTLTHTWREQRWDSFTLVTPNWQCALPGAPYRGADPHGFMKKDEVIAYLDGFIATVRPPAREGVTVQRLAARAEGGYQVMTSAGELSADQVIVATGGYHTPLIPRFAERLPPSIHQLHSAQYRNPQSLPAGPVLVVGSGQSGAQIAEDLHLAGRQVHLAVGEAPRCARFYRGRDVVAWLEDMGYYAISVDKHPLREGVRDNTNHYVTGRDGGRDIDLRVFAMQGMQLHGRLEGLEGGTLRFAPDLAANLDNADAVYNRINASIDKYIQERGISAPPGSVYQPVWRPSEERTTLPVDGLAAVIWCIGFRPDFTWIDLPVFNGRGQPSHVRGVTAMPGLYFLGLPWLHTWGSGRFSGVAQDARHLVDRIAAVRSGALN